MRLRNNKLVKKKFCLMHTAFWIVKALRFPLCLNGVARNTQFSYHVGRSDISDQEVAQGLAMAPAKMLASPIVKRADRSRQSGCGSDSTAVVAVLN